MVYIPYHCSSAGLVLELNLEPYLTMLYLVH